MKKVIALMLVSLVGYAPIGFAACVVCDAAAADNYATASAGKLGRGLANAAFGWVEILRQPVIQENKWEGVSKGFVYAIGRTVQGALEAGTFLVPGAKIPTLDPACPLDWMGGAGS